MQICRSCTERTAELICRCADPAVKLCEVCVVKHQASDRMRTHELMPIETLPYIDISGYPEAYKARTGSRRAAAQSELDSNIALLSQWRDDLESLHVSLHKMVSDHWETQQRELSSVQSTLSSAIQRGVREHDRTSILPDPELDDQIAKNMRQFQPGIFRLVSTRTNVKAYEEQFRKLINDAVLEIKLQPIGVAIDTEMETVVVESSGLEGRLNGPRNRRQGLGSNAQGNTFITTQFIVVAIVCLLAGVLLSNLPWTRLSAAGSQKCSQMNPTYTYKVETVNFTSGDYLSYSGEWLNGMKHGFGVLKTKDGSVYEGHWANDTKRGYGKLIEPDNSTYEGTWRDNKRDGFGIEVYDAVNTGKEVTKTVFAGEFSNNQRHGLGLQLENWTSTYYGLWKGANNNFSSKIESMMNDSSLFYCRSAEEHQTVFSSKPTSFDNEDLLEAWEFTSSSSIYLTGFLFTAIRNDTYLKNLSIFRERASRETIELFHEQDDPIYKPISVISFQSPVHIFANISYIAGATFNRNSAGMREIDPKTFQGDVHFKITLKPRYFRGFKYYKECQDRTRKF